MRQVQEHAYISQSAVRHDPPFPLPSFGRIGFLFAVI